MRHPSGVRYRPANGMGDLVPAVIPIMPDPVLTPDMVAAMRATTAGGMGRLGCSSCESGGSMNGLGIPGTVLWPELAYETQQGRDVDYTVVGLAGVGDWVAANNVPGQAGIINAFGGGDGKTNGIVNALALARGMGVGAIDTTSLTNFMTSVETGTSTFLGVNLPNWAWVGGGALLLFMAAGGHKKFGR